MFEVGPQCPGERGFLQRMRLHQSWYRAEVLQLPVGVRVSAKGARPLGNMLTKEDGARGMNFLTREIAAYVLERTNDPRLLCNMLASPPMCLNLFAPIALDPDIGLRLAQSLIGENSRLSRLAQTRFEYEPKPYEEHLDDNTAFDAFVEVEDDEGHLGFIGVETKLTEPFSRQVYPIVPDSPYRRWIDHAHAPWLRDSVAQLESSLLNQLFRNHALSLAARHRTGSPYSFGALVVVYHPADETCPATLQKYRQHLRDDYDVLLLERPLDDVVRRFRPCVADTPFAKWLDRFERRYVDLTGSAHLTRGGA